MQTQSVSTKPISEESVPQKENKQRIHRAEWITEVDGLPHYLSLEEVNKPNLTTAEAAYFLNRRPQTLRGWACLENGPIRPRRIGGLLAWATAEVKILAGISQ